MKNLKKAFFLIVLLITWSSCEKKQENPVSDLETLRNTNNKGSYPAKQMDSIQALNSITQQKVQEVFDLSNLYLSGEKDTEIDSLIYNQMKSFFYKPDSLTFKNLFSEMDSLNVKNAKVTDLSVFKTVYKKDTLDYAKFMVEYFDEKNKSILKDHRYIQYYLHNLQVQDKKEFKFYLLRFYTQPLKDSIDDGVTK